MKKVKKTKKIYFVDIPRFHGDWEQVETFHSKEQALKFCKKHWGTEDGKVNLITEQDDE